MDQGTKAKRRKTKGAVGRRRREDAESCRKMIGAVKCRGRQKRASEEISGTGAKGQQNRDQRDQPNKEERVQGDRKGSDKRKNRGIEGTDTEGRVQGIKRRKPNQRGEQTKTGGGGDTTRSQSKGRLCSVQVIGGRSRPIGGSNRVVRRTK